MIRAFDGIEPRIPASCYIDEQASIIGDVELGEDCSVWPMTVIRGDVNYVRIGESTNIQDGSVLHVSHAGEFNPEGSPLIIGDRVTVGHKVVLHACSIGDECLIGMGSIVMDNTVIEDRVMIGAGTLVPPDKVLQSGYLYLGNPCKRVRQLKPREIEYLDYSAAHYQRLMQRYLPGE